VRALALRPYRVSHLGAHAAQEDGHLPGRDRLRRGPRPARLHVVLVVVPGDGPIPVPPPTAARRMPLALTGRRPAGPLPGPQAGMGTEQRLAEGAGRTPGARSGHRSPPGLRWTRYPTNNSGPHSGCIHGGRSKTTQVGFSLGGRTRTMLSGDDPDRISPGHGYRCCGGKWSRRRRCAHARGPSPRTEQRGGRCSHYSARRSRPDDYSSANHLIVGYWPKGDMPLSSLCSVNDRPVVFGRDGCLWRVSPG